MPCGPLRHGNFGPVADPLMDRFRLLAARWILSPLQGVVFADWLRALRANGFAVAPPSNTYREPKGGGSYRWAKGHSPVDIPLAELDPVSGPLLDWWQDIVAQRSHLTSAKSSELRDTSGKKAAWHLLAQTIPEGRRNDTLVRIGGWLRLYHPAPVVEELLRAINEARCRPPLDPEEVRAIAKGVYRYAQRGVNGHPRAAVPRYVREERTDG